ncbi:MAG: NAD(P)-dependent oxidoreductase [Verrucomicrobia bacterium]|nr:NAD(P)-dependent oxidoreductase [Verrucomicrobiota bacterium]MBV8377698.1 NAD(P)-dependent oxidoreductase [Verrucomicrobiota bacterium]
MKVALIGLGTMGSGMGAQLLKAGFALTIFNRTSERAKPLLELGASLATNPREAAKNAEVIISMVAEDTASRGVWLGPEGALSDVTPKSLLIESSTLSSRWVQQLAAEAAARACAFLEAPVTGSKTQAESGQLVFLVGGDSAVLDDARPVLQAMGREIIHFGPIGSGTKVKLLNNLLVGIQVASFAEMIGLAEHLGVDPESAARFISNGAPGSPMVKIAMQRILARDFTPNFSLRLMAKDLGYAIGEADEASKLPMTSAAKGIFDAGIEEGLEAKDLCSVIELFRARWAQAQPRAAGPRPT